MAMLWYYWWVPWAERTYMYPLFYPRSIEAGARELLAFSSNTLERFESIALQSRFIFYLCVTGFIALVFRNNKYVVLTSFAYCIAFLYFMIKAGEVFSTHEYYVIPFIPILAISGGFMIVTLLPEKSRLLPLVLGCIAAIGIINQWPNFKISESEKKYHQLESICDQYIPKEARIMVSNDDANPMMLYFCHRKGWANDELWQNERWISGQVADGLEYIVVERFRHHTALTFPLLYEDENFLIYKALPRVTE
jgi:hypothetical protein